MNATVRLPGKCISTLLFMLLCFGSVAGTAQTKVACVGNSITYGFDLNPSETYPSKLQALLGTTYSVQNDGVNSTTMLKRCNPSYWTNGKLPQVFSFKPTIVIIKLGTNDTKPENWNTHSTEFKTDYLAMVDTLAAMSSKPRIFVVLPVPVFSNPTATSWGIRDSIIKLEVPIVKQVAAERGLTVIDCNTPLLKFPQYFSKDGVHPNAAGADTIAHVVYRAIMAATSVASGRVSAVRAGGPVVRMDAGGLLSVAVAMEGRSSVEVFDIAGKLVAGTSVDGPGVGVLNTHEFHSGMYLLRTGNGLSRPTFFQRIDVIR